MRKQAVVLAVLASHAGLLMLPGCRGTGNVEALIRRLEPLRVRRANGQVESITFADALARHHAHESQDSPLWASDPSKPGAGHAEDDDGPCIGVAVGYQAARYAGARLFPGETPSDSDIDLSVAGSMAGVWDVLDLYVGRTLARPRGRQKEMSLASFTFTARRVSSGKTVSFRLREGLIPPEFFRLKNRGLDCDHAEVQVQKRLAARRILGTCLRECFADLPVTE